MAATQSREKQILRIQQIAVVLGIFIMLIKFAAYYFTHSNTILTDALEAIVNIVAGGFALYSLFISAKPKDIDHPYGHGKIEFISAGFEGVLIIVASIVIIWKSILSFIHPEPIHHLEFGAILIVVSGVANYIIGWYLEKKSKEFRSLILEADGKHLQSDGYISLGILIGVGVIWMTGKPILDNVFAIIAGLYVTTVGYKLVRKSLQGIMDETDTDIINPIIAHLDTHRREPWIDIHNLRVIQYGSTLHIDCHVTMPWYYTLEQTHTEIDAIATLINEFSGYPVEVFIHPDPCLPVSCPLCTMHDCKVRQHPFEKRVTWNFDNVTVNRKHQLGKV
ncbi:MAG: cation diffusion facilitator family transporter [Bacteroidetes bacterium]|nr:cation diffusion facilitator family transporter [Bacteroidota bacterium]